MQNTSDSQNKYGEVRIDKITLKVPNHWVNKQKSIPFQTSENLAENESLTIMEKVDHFRLCFHDIFPDSSDSQTIIEEICDRLFKLQFYQESSYPLTVSPDINDLLSCQLVELEIAFDFPKHQYPFFLWDNDDIKRAYETTAYTRRDEEGYESEYWDKYISTQKSLLIFYDKDNCSGEYVNRMRVEYRLTNKYLKNIKTEHLNQSFDQLLSLLSHYLKTWTRSLIQAKNIRVDYQLLESQSPYLADIFKALVNPNPYIGFTPLK